MECCLKRCHGFPKTFPVDWYKKDAEGRALLKQGPPGTLAVGAGLRVLILSRSPRQDRHPQLRQYARTFTQSRDGFSLEAQTGGKAFARPHRIQVHRAIQDAGIVFFVELVMLPVDINGAQGQRVSVEGHYLQTIDFVPEHKHTGTPIYSGYQRKSRRGSANPQTCFSNLFYCSLPPAWVTEDAASPGSFNTSRITSTHFSSPLKKAGSFIISLSE
ncbi:hypothetical protein AOLI_G00312780 [Acnodon oligacanthus]